MHDVSFDEALDFIQLIDSRYHREGYFFVREALDHTQERMEKDRLGRSHHVTGQELLSGIKDLALQKFGPMALMLFHEWGIKACLDFGEIVFNMVELGGSPAFSVDDFIQLKQFASRLKGRSDPVSQFLWEGFSDATRQALLAEAQPEVLGEILATELNRLIVSGPIYEPQRFMGVSLCRPTQCLIGHKLKGAHLARLNRMLLEEVYPSDIVKSHGLLAKTEQDSRADFEDGYDFYEAFQKPFLPKSKQRIQSATTPASTGF